MLIPNVREWYADRSDCGPGGDGDGPPMSRVAMIESAFAGTELEGLGEELLDRSVLFMRTALDTYNHDCNAEFRARFATRLRASVRRRERDDALLRLSGSGERRAGYYRFADAARATPPRADRSTGAAAEILADPTHPVSRTLRAFWAEAVPTLRTPQLVCPAAFLTLTVARDLELTRLRATPATYARLVERAASSRRQQR